MNSKYLFHRRKTEKTVDAKGEEEDDVTLISGGKLSAAARKNKKESKGISEGEGGRKAAN